MPDLSHYDPTNFAERARVLLMGGLGGLCLWLVSKHDIREGVVALVVGAIVAFAFDPLTKPILAMFVGADPTVGEGRLGSLLAAFLIGLCGVQVVRYIVSKFTNYAEFSAGADKKKKDDKPQEKPDDNP